MGKSIREIVDALEEKFPEGAPTDGLVRDQGFDYLPQHWTSRWPDTLPVPNVLLDGERKHINREGIFAISSAPVSSDEDVLNLYVAMGAWGTGTKAQRVVRAVKPLHEQGAVAALARSLDAARSGQPVEAYRRLKITGEDRIKHLGPAFFTKWLYFSAYDSTGPRNGPAPLILDARVANALGWKRQGWTSSDYGRYLDMATEIQDTWCPEKPTHVIEYALFKLGGN
jgi:hypothetical protein